MVQIVESMPRAAINRSVPRTVNIAGVLATALLASGCGYLQDLRDERPGIQMDQLKVAPGYVVGLFATDSPKARQMAVGSRRSVRRLERRQCVRAALGRRARDKP